jgi:PAS domain S-box-containing protein
MTAQLKVDALNLPLAPLHAVQQPPLASLAHSLNIKLFGTVFHFMVGPGTQNLVLIVVLLALLLAAIVLLLLARRRTRLVQVDSQTQTVTDITERKRVEEECRLLASIVESSEDAIIGKTLDGIVTTWNRGAEDLYGYSAEEAVGRSIAILAPPELSDEFAAILEELMRGGSLDHFETERIAKEGKRISVSLTISPIRDASERLVGASSIARDITKRKRAELEQHASELRYRRLFESARDGILILDGNSGKIVDVNPYLIELLRFPKEELLGKELWQIGTFKDISASKAAFVELQARDFVRYDDLPLESSEGTITHVEVVANSYLEGTNRVVQCNIRDISKRNLSEEVLKEANRRLEQTLAELKAKTSDLTAMTQQLWQASKLTTMGELAASIAHELNNPLTTISLRIESLGGDLSNDEEKSHTLKIIADEVDRMGKLIGRLLQFSRHNGREISTLNIREEIENSLELVEYHLRAQNIEVVREFDATLPTIEADRQQLRQIFLNLLTNASDAMSQGGKLITRVKSVDPENGVRGVRIELADSGSGITPADLKRIWEPFFTTKAEGKGTGLGLAITRRAIEAHHGTISIDSQFAKGTTVTIFLPATNGVGSEL